MAGISDFTGYWYNTTRLEDAMLITEIANGEEKQIRVDTGNKTSFIFLAMLNHFDPFVHEWPIWKNRIITKTRMAMMAEYTNSSSATA